MSNKLLIGAGAQRWPGFRTLDVNRFFKPDYLDRVPLKSSSPVCSIRWDEIHWIHGVGSLVPWEAADAIGQFKRLLRPGGLLVLEQPNLEIAAVYALHPGADASWLFGDPSLKNAEHMNRWAYTPEQLIRVVRDAGFTRVEIKEAKHHNPKRDFRLEAWA